jgi:hypothetical protein
MEGMVNSRESAILSEAAEAVTWRHALELEDETRKGQRVIIYPKEMTKLTEVLATKNPNVDTENGHQLAYSLILQTAQAYEHPPLFMSEDNEQITSNDVMKESVAEWMNTAAKVETGNRRRVLEDGRDVMNSDEEDAIKDVEPDEKPGMYAPGCSSIVQARMSQEQAVAHRAAAQAQALSGKDLPRSKTPADGSSDDDDPKGPDSISSMTKGYFRRNKNKPTSTSALIPTSTPEPVRQPTPANSDTEYQQEMTEDQKRGALIGKKKAVASQRTPADPKPMTPVSVPLDPPKGTKPVAKAAASQRAPAEPKPTTAPAEHEPLQSCLFHVCSHHALYSHIHILHDFP